MNKKELIQAIKTEIVWYAQPRGNLNSFPKEYLQSILDKAKQLKLLNKEVKQ